MPDTPSPLRLTASQRLNWTAERATAWAKYRESPHLAAPGSSLALDDQIFPASPPSHLIAHRIGHAVEHLEFFLYPLINGGVGYPTAPNTVARSGVVGAAHALWMLDHPDRAERQRRALRMAHYEAAAERTALYEIERVPGTDDGGDAEQQQQRRAVWQSFMDRCDDIKARAVVAGATLGMTAAAVAQRPDDTTIIDYVAKAYVEASGDDDAALVTAYRVLWRTHSELARPSLARDLAQRYAGLVRPRRWSPASDRGGRGRVVDGGVSDGAVHQAGDRTVRRGPAAPGVAVPTPVRAFTARLLGKRPHR